MVAGAAAFAGAIGRVTPVEPPAAEPVAPVIVPEESPLPAAIEAAATASPVAGGATDPAPASPPVAGGATNPAPAAPVAVDAVDPWLGEIFRFMEFRYGNVLRDPARYRLQVLVTRYDPRPGRTRVTEHGYRVDREYFYPASAIKTFMAVAALRRLGQLSAELGVHVDHHTPLALCELDRDRCVRRDPSNLEGGTITVGHEIRKMQLVSNNLAFNRLYDFVGHREVNELLHGMGFTSLRIRHRIEMSEVGSLATPRVQLLLGRGEAVVLQARRSDLELSPTPAERLLVGRRHYDPRHGLVEQPADFSVSNYASLRDLHRLLIALTRPELAPDIALGLTEAQRAFLVRAMSDDPLLSPNPRYESSSYAGPRYRVMLRGMRKVVPIELLRFVGKGGRAYGFEVDSTLAENRRSGVAVFITAVIYANPNEVVGDDGYAYTGVTGPFLEQLGAGIAQRVLFH